MKIQIFLLVLSASLSARADFSGIWTGEGEYGNSLGQSQKCTRVETKIEQTQTQIAIVYERKVCGSYSVNHSEPIVFAVRQNRIFFDDSVVGSINSGLISIALAQSDEVGMLYYRLRARLNLDGTLQTEERTEADLDSGERIQFYVNGRYSRQPSIATH